MKHKSIRAKAKGNGDLKDTKYFNFFQSELSFLDFYSIASIFHTQRNVLNVYCMYNHSLLLIYGLTHYKDTRMLKLLLLFAE